MALGFALCVAALFGLSRPVLRLATLSDGTRLWNNLPSSLSDTPAEPSEGTRVYVISGAKTTLMRGDQIVNIEGRSLSDWATAARRFAPAEKFAPGAQLQYDVIRDGTRITVPVQLRGYYQRRLISDLGNYAAALVYLGVGLYVFVRRPRLAVSRALLVIGVCMFCLSIFRAVDFEPTDVLYRSLFGWSVLMMTLVAPHLFSGMLHFSLVFPTPLPVVARHRWLIPAIYGFFGVFFVLLNYAWLPTQIPDTLEAYRAGWRFSYVLGVVVMLLTLLIGAINGRRSHHALERQQWMIVFAGAAVAIGSNLFAARLPEALGVTWRAPEGLLALFEIAFPLSLAIAVMRYRLFDIGTLVNHALVYGVLTLCVIALYALLVLGFGTLIEARDNVWLSLITTGLIAMLFQPLRALLQRWVDHSMFGQRNNPYQVLTTLSERLGVAHEARSGLQGAVESLTRALVVPYAAISIVRSGDGAAHAADEALSVAAASGDLTCATRSNLLRMPLMHRGAQIGELHIAPRMPSEDFSRADERLIHDLVPPITLAAHNARLTLELQHSRQRVIGALEDERRRLRRDLHDGFGPTLATVILNLDTLRSRLSKGATLKDLEGMLTNTRALAEAALGDVRRVAYDLRPPALDDVGLTGALRQHADRLGSESGMRVEVRSAVAERALPAAVEVAAYRVATEALLNAVRHARARNGVLDLRIERGPVGEVLHIAVCDDGVGLPPQVQMGVGLRGMRERVDELGGTLVFEAVQPHGTRVLARLPLSREEAV